MTTAVSKKQNSIYTIPNRATIKAALIVIPGFNVPGSQIDRMTDDQLSDLCHTYGYDDSAFITSYDFTPTVI